MSKTLIGSIEYCSLPKLEIENLTVRVDTGAATSSLHVDDIEEFERDGELWVKFLMHPDIHDVSRTVKKAAKVVTQKRVKSSTATREKRYVIETEIAMASLTWPIEITLTDRSEMTYLMLLGRQAMIGRFIVDPEFEHLLA